MCLPFHDLAERTLEQGTHAGFMYEIVHNGIGYRCGYVRLEPGHPWFGKDTEEIDCAVHHGLTFAASGVACPHGPEAEWWIGFDCCHAWDLPDPALPNSERMVEAFAGCQMGAEQVRTQEYVREQCFSLAEQAEIAAAV